MIFVLIFHYLPIKNLFEAPFPKQLDLSGKQKATIFRSFPSLPCHLAIPAVFSLLILLTASLIMQRFLFRTIVTEQSRTYGLTIFIFFQLYVLSLRQYVKLFYTVHTVQMLFYAIFIDFAWYNIG